MIHVSLHSYFGERGQIYTSSRRCHRDRVVCLNFQIFVFAISSLIKVYSLMEILFGLQVAAFIFSYSWTLFSLENGNGFSSGRQEGRKIDRDRRRTSEEGNGTAQRKRRKREEIIEFSKNQTNFLPLAASCGGTKDPFCHVPPSLCFISSTIYLQKFGKYETPRDQRACMSGFRKR